MILEGNAFVERVLPRQIIRKLTNGEMAIYRAPFPTPESRVPTWRFPNELPIAGKPGDVYSTIEHAHMALSRSSYRKLLFVGDPGTLVSPVFGDSFAKRLNNCRVLHLGLGRHYLQEDHPEAIGKAIAEWIKDAEAIPQELSFAGRVPDRDLVRKDCKLEFKLLRESVLELVKSCGGQT
ncbi:MAG: haloalkane dehalogenase [Bryobacterales bacterium]|nr:haloalkane dehalogenase [Bryobacterales bacterium]